MWKKENGRYVLLQDWWEMFHEDTTKKFLVMDELYPTLKELMGAYEKILYNYVDIVFDSKRDVEY